eukprot:6201134-Pleurochrysis_carterae.AAC.1
MPPGTSQVVGQTREAPLVLTHCALVSSATPHPPFDVRLHGGEGGQSDNQLPISPAAAAVAQHTPRHGPSLPRRIARALTASSCGSSTTAHAPSESCSHRSRSEP